VILWPLVTVCSNVVEFLLPPFFSSLHFCFLGEYALNVNRYQMDMFGLKGITNLIPTIRGTLDLYLMDLYRAESFGLSVILLCFDF